MGEASEFSLRRSRVNYKPILSAFFTMGLLLALSTCRSTPLGEGASEGILKISVHKSRAEQRVRWLKEDHDNAVLSAGDFYEARRLYGEAKAAVDAWITRLQVDLQAGISFRRLPASHSDALSSASRRSFVFQDFVDGVVKRRIRFSIGGFPPPADESASLGYPEILESMTDSGIKIWHEFRLSNQERRVGIIERLDRVRFREFEEIGEPARDDPEEE